MSNMALLNNIDHSDLKIIRKYGAEFGDSVNQSVAFPTEFAELQRIYPILFRKDEAGEFQSVVLLGLDKGENLFLDGDQWQARYVPALHERGPFKIGFQNQEVDGEVRREPVIHVDLDSSRISREEGAPLFLPQGGNAPYLQHVTHVLRVINFGMDMMKPMFEAFQQADLMEPVSLEVKLDEATTYQVPDVYTISEEKLAALSGEMLERLHKAGFLRAAYLVLASLSNINTLIEMKNAKSMAAAS
ncbi:MAG: SapC family protein [Alphaproteobacteria bacterium]|nr:peptide ABC transporter permease [Hyphomonas sp.]MBR9806978.1 SapC family protein [Alphaproteobacteria bacterium]|tara:strand:- start:7946 stop:8680 length:735 start_codon:yes stop_codon:yes gene_type:complete